MSTDGGIPDVEILLPMLSHYAQVVIMPPIRLQTDILYLIFTHLSLATLGNMVRFLPSHLRNVAMDVFKARVLA